MLRRDQLAAADDPLYAVIDDLNREVHAQPADQQVSYVRSMSPGRRMVWGTFMVDGEVNNGGFNQFFWNSSRDYIHEAADGFRLIGASAHLELLEEAVRRLEERWPQISSFHERGTLEAFSESYDDAVFDDLDRRYYELDSHDLIVEYIQSHPTEFFA